MSKRAMDVLLGVMAVIVFALPAALVAVAVRVTSPGPVLYWSDRIGRDNKIFSMPKFRSMEVNTPVKATHLLTDGKSYLTPIGGVLRRFSLDEIPQLWCVLKGEMGLVGPRPALFNQDDLIALRTKCGVHHLTPGLTGWAQINGRDELSIEDKVKLDEQYLQLSSIGFDLKILFLTVLKVIKADSVVH
jgi:O-antigen biosynthesis protein WbqP